MEENNSSRAVKTEKNHSKLQQRSEQENKMWIQEEDSQQSQNQEECNNLDEEQQMMSQSKKENANQQTKGAKRYKLVNPNLIAEQFRASQSNCVDLRLLSLKSLILFLLLTSLVMVCAYKIIQQIYEIQHPQQLLRNKITQSRMNMVSQPIYNSPNHGKDPREISKASGHGNEISQGNNKNENKIQTIQKRYEQNIQGRNPLANPKPDKNVKPVRPYITRQHLTAQEVMIKEGVKQEFKSLLRQRQQTIEGFQIQSKKKKQAVQIQGGKQHQNQQKVKGKHVYEKKLTSQKLRAPGPASRQPPGPVSKANITRQHAIQWKKYLQMTSLPLNTSLMTSSMLLDQYNYYQQKYRISKYKQLPICVVIPSYNNVKDDRYKQNLMSILQQNYTNYHIVLIDDKSQDNTGQLAKEYLRSLGQGYEKKVKVIINQQRKMAMPNLRHAAMHECQQNQLFIIVDGDDLLVGRQVFKIFSAVMQQKGYWVMWTNFLTPKGSIGYSRQYTSVHRRMNYYRKAGFVMSHLRAYYTRLFRLVKEQDLKGPDGEYFHAANDVAIGIPILQMAHQHAGYLPEINYFYNLNTGLNNHRVRLKQQKRNDKLIRKKPRYQALDKLQFGLPYDQAKQVYVNQVTKVSTNLKNNSPGPNHNNQPSSGRMQQQAADKDIQVKQQLHNEQMNAQRNPDDQSPVIQQNKHQHPVIQQNKHQHPVIQQNKHQHPVIQQNKHQHPVIQQNKHQNQEGKLDPVIQNKVLQMIKQQMQLHKLKQSINQ